MGVIAKRSSLTSLPWGRRMVGPRDCAWSCGWEQGAGRLRGTKHTSAPLPCARGGENMATKFAKLVLFSSVKSVLPFLVTRVEHWEEVLTFRGCCRPWARVIPSTVRVLGAVPQTRSGLIKDRACTSQLYTQLSTSQCQRSSNMVLKFYLYFHKRLC